jgi:hypothetical protein
MAVGLLSTANAPSNLNAVSFAAAIARLMPNGMAPLVGITQLLKDEMCQNIEHGFFTKTMIFPALEINNVGGYASGITAFTVDAYTDIVPGDLVLNDRTGEVMLVLTTPTNTSVTVQRAVGTTAAAALLDDDDMRTIGNAFEQGSVRPSAVAIIAERYVNYTQIFRNSWAVTKTAAAVPQIAGAGYVSESKRDCAALHAVAMEKALIFGEKFMGTRNGQPFHTMEGIIPRIKTAAAGNVTTLGATTNWTQLEAALDVTLRTTTDPKGGNIRTMFVGGTARRVIHAIARLNSTYQITTAENSWGLQIDTIRAPRGTFEMIEHPLFNAYGATSTWAKMALILDLNAFGLAYLRKTSEANYNEKGALVDNGVDAEGGTLTTELTQQIINPAAFGVIYNFTAGAAG